MGIKADSLARATPGPEQSSRARASLSMVVALFLIGLISMTGQGPR